MKNIIRTALVEITLRSLDAQSERRMEERFAQLANWDQDESVRKNSFPLEGMPGVYVWHVDADLRIFFSLHDEDITLLDIARKRTIMKFGQPAGAK